jgi:hypothetical protein
MELYLHSPVCLYFVYRYVFSSLLLFESEGQWICEATRGQNSTVNQTARTHVPRGAALCNKTCKFYPSSTLTFSCTEMPRNKKEGNIMNCKFVDSELLPETKMSPSLKLRYQYDATIASPYTSAGVLSSRDSPTSCKTRLFIAKRLSFTLHGFHIPVGHNPYWKASSCTVSQEMCHLYTTGGTYCSVELCSDNNVCIISVRSVSPWTCNTPSLAPHSPALHVLLPTLCCCCNSLTLSTVTLKYTYEVPRERYATLLPSWHYFKARALLLTVRCQCRSRHFAQTSATCATDWTSSYKKLRATAAEVSPICCCGSPSALGFDRCIPFWPSPTKQRAQCKIESSWRPIPSSSTTNPQPTEAVVEEGTKRTS